jgi:hypothetical protein
MEKKNQQKQNSRDTDPVIGVDGCDGWLLKLGNQCCNVLTFVKNLAIRSNRSACTPVLYMVELTEVFIPTIKMCYNQNMRHM